MANPEHVGPFVKPERGERRADKKERKHAAVKYEREQKAIVRKRDGHKCRFPGCKVKEYLEVAHLHHKGIGGNPSANRSPASVMILFCQPHHRGAFSMHSGDIEVRPLTPAGTDGPCEVWTVQQVSDDYGLHRKMTRFAYELSLGIWRMA